MIEISAVVSAATATESAASAAVVVEAVGENLAIVDTSCPEMRCWTIGGRRRVLHRPLTEWRFERWKRTIAENFAFCYQVVSYCPLKKR